MSSSSPDPGVVTTVDGDAALDALVDTLLDPRRERPVVVVTVPSHRAAPFIDADAIAREAGDQADVYVVPTGALTFRMADALTPMAAVYGGAGRLYPPGDEWLDDPYQSPLRFARDAAEGARATEELLEDVLDAVRPSAAGGGSGSDIAYRTPPARAGAPEHDGPPEAADDAAALHRRVRELAEENASLEAQRREHLAKIEALRAEVERLRSRVVEAKARGRRAAPASPASAGFADPLDQLRWDVRRTWVDRVPPADKPRLALRRYAVGPQFLDSLERLEGVSRDRVLHVVVDVLVGRPPADTHPLRRSVGADDRPVTRGEAVCLRAPLQTGTPSARRLHYWKTPEGDIELSRVVAHDDFDP